MLKYTKLHNKAIVYMYRWLVGNLRLRSVISNVISISNNMKADMSIYWVRNRNFLDMDIFVHILSSRRMYMQKLSTVEIKNKENIIALAVFGSFETDFWIEGKSDIDVLILLERDGEISFEFKLEDELTILLKEHFSYDNIHLTFIYINEFESPLAEQYLKSKNKLIIDPVKEIDFRLYVNKYKRNNGWLEDLIKKDTKILRSEKNDTVL